jgi:hypothetical protein
MDRLNAFHFHNDEVLYHQVHPVPELDLLSVVNYGQTDLAGHLDPALPDFMRETSLISAFQQPRAKDSVNVHGR